MACPQTQLKVYISKYTIDTLNLFRTNLYLFLNTKENIQIQNERDMTNDTTLMQITTEHNHVLIICVCPLLRGMTLCALFSSKYIKCVEYRPKIQFQAFWQKAENWKGILFKKFFNVDRFQMKTF